MIIQYKLTFVFIIILSNDDIKIFDTTAYNSNKLNELRVVRFEK